MERKNEKFGALDKFFIREAINGFPYFFFLFSRHFILYYVHIHLSVEICTFNRVMLPQQSTPCGNIVLDEETIILITFFRSNRFTYVKPHNRLLHYAAHTSKQIA